MTTTAQGGLPASNNDSISDSSFGTCVAQHWQDSFREQSIFKKLVSILFVGLLINAVSLSPANARLQDDESRRIEKVKEAIGKLGIGEEARVEITLQDGTKLKGYILNAGTDSFVVVRAKTAVATMVTYSQVTQVKGANRLTAGKVALTAAKTVGVIAAVAGAFTLLTYIILSQSD